MFLKEAFAAASAGAADQREESIADLRKNPFRNFLVVVRKIQFRNAVVGIEYLVWMG